MFLRGARSVVLALLALLLACAGPARAAGAAPVLLVLGDSVSAGYGLAAGTGWVTLLSQRLQAEGYRYTVVNGSITGDTTAGGRARLPAFLRDNQPAIVIIELGGNDALRGGNLAATRANLDAMVAAAQGAKAKVLIVGMQVPPNYGPAYVREFSALFTDVAKAKRVPLVPAFFAGFGDDLSLFQSDRIHPTAAGTGEVARQRLAHAATAAAQMNSLAQRHGPGTKIGIASLADYPERIDVRSPSEFAIDHIPGAVNLPVLTDDERKHVGTLHAQDSAFAARKVGAALRGAQHRAHRRVALRDQAARLGAGRVLLARRQAQRVARACAERNRLEGRAARRRVPDVAPARCRGAGRHPGAVPLRRRLRPDRLGQEPAAFRVARRGRAGAGPGSSWRGTAARCWATCPAIRSRRRRPSTPRCSRRSSVSMRGVPSTWSRKAGRSAPSRFPTHCWTRCAARPASASIRRGNCASRCSRTNTCISSRTPPRSRTSCSRWCPCMAAR